MNGNFTQVPNSLLEALYGGDLTSREIKVMLCIIRYTYGFHRDGAELSMSFIANATGIHQSHIARTVNALERSGLIVRKKNDGNTPQILAPADLAVSQKSNTPSQNGNTAVSQKSTPAPIQKSTQEININKDINIDITNDNFPDDDPYSHLYADYGNF